MSFFEDLTKAREFMELPQLITQKELKKRYKELSKRMHPDKGGSEEQMQKLCDAYRLILEYMDNFRFKLDEQETQLQFPNEYYKKRFF